MFDKEQDLFHDFPIYLFSIETFVMPKICFIRGHCIKHTSLSNDHHAVHETNTLESKVFYFFSNYMNLAFGVYLNYVKLPIKACVAKGKINSAKKVTCNGD